MPKIYIYIYIIPSLKKNICKDESLHCEYFCDNSPLGGDVVPL